MPKASIRPKYGNSEIKALIMEHIHDKIDRKMINALESNNYIQNALTAQTQYFLAQYPPTTAPATRAS